MSVLRQERQKYVTITICQPFQDPFRLIPNAYQMLIRYAKTNGLREPGKKGIVSCIEREYRQDGLDYMDVYMAVE